MAVKKCSAKERNNESKIASFPHLPSYHLDGCTCPALATAGSHSVHAEVCDACCPLTGLQLVVDLQAPRIGCFGKFTKPLAEPRQCFRSGARKKCPKKACTLPEVLRCALPSLGKGSFCKQAGLGSCHSASFPSSTHHFPCNISNEILFSR